MILFALLVALLQSPAPAPPEANPEKRAEVALDEANRAIDNARASYQAGDVSKTNAELESVRSNVDLSLESLEGSHKEARKSKYFKRAELRLRAMMRRLAAFRDEMSADDRGPLESVIHRLQDVHDEILTKIMGKERK